MNRITSSLIFLLVAGLSLQGQVQNLSGVDSTIYISHTIFLPKYPITSGVEPWCVAAADFDGNGTIDLASCSMVDSKINIHLNDGKGNFSNARSYPTGISPRYIFAADLNNDKMPDLLTVSVKEGKVYWHLNQGKGIFTTGKSLSCGIYPHGVVAGDFTGDGNPDIATVANSENKVYLFRADGQGNFTSYTTFLTVEKPRKILLGDMNKDGKMDIVTCGDEGFIFIHYNQNNNFQKIEKLACGGLAVWGFDIADLNKDGFLDIVAASYIDNKLFYFLYDKDHIYRTNSGDHKFLSYGPIITGAMNFDVVVDDFDLDGDKDAITCSSRDHNVNVHLNDGKGHLSSKNAFSSGEWNSRIIGYDVDGDGDKDIITASFKDNTLNIHRNISIDPDRKIVKNCFIEGILRDKKTNQPLQGVISILDEQNKAFSSTKTDEKGYYKLNIPCDHTMKIYAKAPNYPAFEENVKVPEQSNLLKKDIYLEQLVSAFVFGTVKDAKTLKPLNAHITIKDLYKSIVFEVTEQNEYKKELPFARGYTINVEAEGYYPQSSTFALYERDAKTGVERNFLLTPIEKVKIAKIQGVVYNQDTKEKIPNATVKLLNEHQNTLQEVLSDAAGQYAFTVPFGNYKLEASKQLFLPYSIGVKVTDEHAEKPLIQDLPLNPLALDKVFVIDNIYYDYDKATLRKESIPVLEQLVNILQENPTIHVEISGHTDSDGSDEYNLKLSDARAKSVVDYLIKSGIAPERLTAKGYGESKPIAPNDTPANKQKNRRTEMKIIKI